MRPSDHIDARFIPDDDTGKQDELGHVELRTAGLWVETILYEIPLLALISEAYFKFCDRDWTYAGQVEQAKKKGLILMENGCMASEFGSRRRRDYRTQDMVIEGLRQAQEEGAARGYRGKITGTSNVHFAMRYGIPPVGTVAHEWFMGVAAVTASYRSATEAALSYWIATFGKGVRPQLLCHGHWADTSVGAWDRLDGYIRDFVILESLRATCPSFDGPR